MATSGRWPRVRPTARSRWAPTAASSHPNADYNGPDSFTYTITDADGDISTATATINVAPVNDVPVAADDTLSAVEDTPLTGTPAERHPVGRRWQRLAVATGPSNGTVTVGADGSFSFTPNANYNGPDSFDYTITDADRRHLDRHRDDQRRAGQRCAGGRRRHPVRRGRHGAHGQPRDQRHPVG